MARQANRKQSARPKSRTSSTKKFAPKRARERPSTTIGARSNAEVHQRREPKSPMPEQHQMKPGLESKVTPRPHYEAPNYKGADKLVGRVALITGGDSGIGRAVAVLFAREGADVAITYLPEEESDAQETKAAIENEGSRALIIEGDITEEKFCRKAVETAVDNFGKLDILVNNAAYQHGQEKIEDISDEQWDRTFKTNIYGYFRM